MKRLNNTEEFLEWDITQCSEVVKNCESLAIIKRSLKHLYARIEQHTSFIDEVYKDTRHDKKGSIQPSARYLFLKNDIFSKDDIPRCIHCGDYCTFDETRQIIREFCLNPECKKKSSVAKQKESTTQESLDRARDKRTKTNMERYGGNNPMASSEIRAKVRKTNLERYGFECASQSPEVQKKVVETNLERHGVERPSQSEVFKKKTKRTNLERYGVENASQDPEIMSKVKDTHNERFGGWFSTTQECKDKTLQTNLDRYGVSHPMKTQEMRERFSEFTKERLATTDEIERRQETCLERYGHVNPFGGEIIKDKIAKINLNRYGDERPTRTDGLRFKASETSKRRNGGVHCNLRHVSKESISILNDKDKLEELYNRFGSLRAGKKLGVWDGTVVRYMKKHGIPINQDNKTSSLERDIYDFLNEHGIEYRVSDRSIIGPKEIDIVIPSHNLCIEVNGVYWHSEKFGRDKYYHLGKTKACEEAGYRLIHIFDDELYERTDQVFRKLANLLGIREDVIYARKCEVRVVPSDEVGDFYDVNHIQGSYKTKMNYALYYKGEMVACMSFKKNFGYMDLVRYATSCNVVGGFTKLVKAFHRDNPEVEELVSFADMRWSDGGLYKNNGWELEYITKPNYYYVVNGMRTKKQKFRKSRLKTMLGDAYDDSMSESQIMQALEIPRVWDCGLMKFRLKL